MSKEKQSVNSSNPNFIIIKKEPSEKTKKEVNEHNEKVKKQLKWDKIAEKFPDLSKYKDKLKNFGCKYLMLIGGTTIEVEACIKNIEKLCFGEVSNLSCIDKADKILLDEIYGKFSTDKVMPAKEFLHLLKKDKINTQKEKVEMLKQIRMCEKEKLERKGVTSSLSSVLNRNRDKKRGERVFRNYKLCILNSISRISNDVWLELAIQFRDTGFKPDFLIATVPSGKEFDELPKRWRGLFEVVSLEEEPVNESVAKITGSEDKQKEPRVSQVKEEKKPLKFIEYLRLGDHPDTTFYAKVKGEIEPKPIDILSDKAQEYRALLTLYNGKNERVSIDKLLCECRANGHKKGEYIGKKKKGNLQRIVSRLNTILEKFYKRKKCIELDDQNEEHYKLNISCRS